MGKSLLPSRLPSRDSYMISYLTVPQGLCGLPINMLGIKLTTVMHCRWGWQGKGEDGLEEEVGNGRNGGVG